MLFQDMKFLLFEIPHSSTLAGVELYFISYSWVAEDTILQCSCVLYTVNVVVGYTKCVLIKLFGYCLVKSWTSFKSSWCWAWTESVCWDEPPVTRLHYNTSLGWKKWWRVTFLHCWLSIFMAVYTEVVISSSGQVTGMFAKFLPSTDLL